MSTEAFLFALVTLILGAVLGYWISARALRSRVDTARSEGRSEAAAELARLTERCARHEDSLKEATQNAAKLNEDLTRSSNRGAELERHNAQLLERVDTLTKVEVRLDEALGALAAREVELADAQKEGVRLQSELRSANRDLEQLGNDFAQAGSSLQTTRDDVIRLTADVSRLQANLDAERKTEEQISVGREMLLTQFKALSSEILDEKTKAFTEHNAKELTQLLTPMKEQFTACTNEFKEVNRVAGQERATLGEQFKSLVQQSQAVGIQAENLTKALKGDQKTQGTWGEIVLESLLELAGLVEGTHFTCQESFSNEEDKSRSIPDVVLKLPNERHLVIDAKMSLTAYERAASSSDAAERDSHLKQHVASLRAHIKGLASKNYQEIYKLKSLDFVLLFVPVESAFGAAVSNDNQLFRDAWEKNVIVVSPSTLLFVVRTVAYLWRQELQVRNVRDIAKRGAVLYDKLCGFVSDLEDVGKHLVKSQSAYESAFKRLRTGDGNVIRQAEMLRELGVKPTKKLPESLLLDDYSSEGSSEVSSADQPSPQSTESTAS